MTLKVRLNYNVVRRCKFSKTQRMVGLLYAALKVMSYI